jgi:pantoate--beta-alanine ligase
MRTIRDLATLRTRVRAWKEAGDNVAVVPTMGALHPGHLSLVQAARAACNRVIVTLFVNPRQFNNPADLDKYPRTEEADAKLLEPHGVDVLFAPPATIVYPLQPEPRRVLPGARGRPARCSVWCAPARPF